MGSGLKERAPFTGLVAATYTPMDAEGRLNLALVPRIVDQLASEGVSALYVCGSTGEGVSLTREERHSVAQAYAEAARGRLRVIVQVGHNSLSEARALASHAQSLGVDAVSATSPSYFKPSSVDALVDSMAEVARGAPELPFYYYHIPALTGAALDMPEFLATASERIPNLAGLKYTMPTVHEYQACLEMDGGCFEVLWGTDEMLLSALVIGARGAVGSTYNIAAPLYVKILRAFEDGKLDEARRLQALSVTMVRELMQFPFHPAMKQVMTLIGMDAGPCRPPHLRLTEEQITGVRRALEKIGYFEWGRPEGS